jgi:hypothetical protein
MNKIEKISINGNYIWVDKNIQPVSGWYYDNFIKKIRNTNGAEYEKAKDITWQIIAASPELSLESVPSYVEWLAEIETNIRIIKHKTPYQIARQYFDGFIKGYQESEKELPTWDDVRKAIELARTLIDDKCEFEVENILGSSDNTYGIKEKYSQEEIVQQIKKSKNG